MHPFPGVDPWKHQKTLRFPDVFRGQRKGALGTNGLKTKNHLLAPFSLKNLFLSWHRMRFSRLLLRCLLILEKNCQAESNFDKLAVLARCFIPPCYRSFVNLPLENTAKNTVISPDFLVWKFAERHSFRIVSGDSNCAFPQNFHTRKLGEITVFFAV